MRTTLSPKAKKQLQKLSKIGQIVVVRKIRSLSGQNIVIGEEKLKGHKNIYRVRVGDYRIVYSRMSRKLRIILIGHRKDIYKLVDRLL